MRYDESSMKNFLINLVYFVSYSFGILGVGIVALIVIDTIKFGGGYLYGTLVLIVIASIVSISGFIVSKFLPATQKKKLKIMAWIICGILIVSYVGIILFYEPILGY